MIANREYLISLLKKGKIPKKFLPYLKEDKEDVYNFLKSIGMEENDIEKYPILLLRDLEAIKTQYEELKRIGISDKEIIKYPRLLTRSLKKLKETYEKLVELGISEEKIASEPWLLTKDLESIKENYEILIKIGVPKRKIASYPLLLGLSSENIKKRYQHIISLLRDDYKNRNSGRDSIIFNPLLLSVPPETIEANIQFLSYIGFDEYNPILLQTKPQTKRKKIAILLRELFRYETLSKKDKNKAIKELYQILKENPKLLINSSGKLKKKS